MQQPRTPVPTVAAIAVGLAALAYALNRLVFATPPGILPLTRIVFSPAVAALALAILSGRRRLREMLRALVRRPPALLLVLALALPPVIFGFTGAVSLISAGSAAAPLHLPGAGFVASVTAGAVLQGLIEEPAWRGFLQPLLQERLAPLGSYVLVGLVWYGWHVVPNPGQGSLLQLVYLVAVATVLGWLYDRSGRALAVPIAGHAAINITSGLLQPVQSFAPAVSLWVLAAGAVAIASRRTAARSPASAPAIT